MTSKFTTVALAVAEGPGGADFEPGALLSAFLLDDDRVNAMCRTVIRNCDMLPFALERLLHAYL